VTQAGCTHEIIKTGGGAKAAKTPAFKWVNTALGNIKAAIVGTCTPCGKSMCRAISPNSNIGSTADTSWKT
jgi:tRNA 2-selenouridine synthase SelU